MKARPFARDPEASRTEACALDDDALRQHALRMYCPSRLGFLRSHWRAGPASTYRMGLRHGIYCLGCCWALMAVLFAVGVMNLAWVGALPVFSLPAISTLSGKSIAGP